MCEPVHYRIDYEINPWMRRSNRVDGARALDQWRRLRERIEGLGVAVELIEQAPETPDMTFTANAGVVIGDRFIPSNFRFPERQPEEDHFIHWFRHQGYTVETIHLPHYWEGEGDVLPAGDRVFAGYRYRTEFRALDHLEEALGPELVRLELADERFYHLDTCFAPLGDGRALYEPAAFTVDGRAQLAGALRRPDRGRTRRVAAVRVQRAGGRPAGGDEHGLPGDRARPPRARLRGLSRPTPTSSSRRAAA